MIGTLINIATVLVGGTLGLFFHGKTPKRIETIVFQAMGLFTVALGVNMSVKAEAFLLIVISLIVGSVIGEWIDLEHKTKQFGEYIKQKSKINNQHFSEGLVTAFLIFCVGSMTILGAIEEGLGNPPNLLVTKAIMDGFTAIILASTFGIGVLFSVFPLFILQGGLSLLAIYAQPYLNNSIINELTATGGILLIGLGISILEIKKIRVLNMIPSLIIIIALAYFFA
jgi:uncharacterized membrane protein YqgA involved in biofilm formation